MNIGVDPSSSTIGRQGGRGGRAQDSLHPSISTTAGIFAIMLAGCAAHLHRSTDVLSASSSPPELRLIGRIATVNEEQQFVLIDLQSSLYVPAPGAILQSRRDATETAHLRATEEQKRPFIAADIVDGHPAQGDEVVQKAGREQ